MATLTFPYSFTPDTLADANQVNANFNAVSTVVNGELNYINIVMLDIRAANTQSWGAGYTGDTQPRITMNTTQGLQGGPGTTTAPDIQFWRSAANTWQIVIPGGGSGTLDMNNGQIINANLGVAAVVNNGRLYGVTTAPYTDTSSSGTGTIYFGPTNLGNQITIENATSSMLVTQTFTEASISVTLSDGIYDVYAASSSPTAVTLSVVAWSSNTPPARTTDIAGRLCANGNVGALLIGVVSVVSNTAYSFSGYRGIYSWQNQIQVPLVAKDATATWTYNSATIRNANASTVNGVGQVTVLHGVQQQPVTLTTFALAAESAGGTTDALIAIGVDNTTPVASATHYIVVSDGITITCGYTETNLGVHTYNRLEQGTFVTFSGAAAGFMYGICYV